MDVDGWKVRQSSNQLLFLSHLSSKLMLSSSCLFYTISSDYLYSHFHFSTAQVIITCFGVHTFVVHSRPYTFISYVKLLWEHTETRTHVETWWTCGDLVEMESIIPMLFLMASVGPTLRHSFLGMITFWCVVRMKKATMLVFYSSLWWCTRFRQWKVYSWLVISWERPWLLQVISAVVCQSSRPWLAESNYNWSSFG